jgi:hypothetical protein
VRRSFFSSLFRDQQFRLLTWWHCVSARSNCSPRSVDCQLYSRVSLPLIVWFREEVARPGFKVSSRRTVGCVCTHSSQYIPLYQRNESGINSIFCCRVYTNYGKLCGPQSWSGHRS